MSACRGIIRLPIPVITQVRFLALTCFYHNAHLSSFVVRTGVKSAASLLGSDNISINAQNARGINGDLAEQNRSLLGKGPPLLHAASGDALKTPQEVAVLTVDINGVDYVKIEGSNEEVARTAQRVLQNYFCSRQKEENKTEDDGRAEYLDMRKITNSKDEASCESASKNVNVGQCIRFSYDRETLLHYAESPLCKALPTASSGDMWNQVKTENPEVIRDEVWSNDTINITQDTPSFPDYCRNDCVPTSPVESVTNNGANGFPSPSNIPLSGIDKTKIIRVASA